MRVRPCLIALATALALAGCDLPTGVFDAGSGSRVVGGPTLGASDFAITRTNIDPATVDVMPGQTMTLSVETSRPADHVSWVALGGFLSSNSGNPVTWTAPSAAGSYTIGVTASAGSSDAQAAFRFNVTP